MEDGLEILTPTYFTLKAFPNAYVTPQKQYHRH